MKTITKSLQGEMLGKYLLRQYAAMLTEGLNKKAERIVKKNENSK